MVDGGENVDYIYFNIVIYTSVYKKLFLDYALANRLILDFLSMSAFGLFLCPSRSFSNSLYLLSKFHFTFLIRSHFLSDITFFYILFLSTF